MFFCYKFDISLWMNVIIQNYTLYMGGVKELKLSHMAKRKIGNMKLIYNRLIRPEMLIRMQRIQQTQKHQIDKSSASNMYAFCDHENVLM